MDSNLSTSRWSVINYCIPVIVGCSLILTVSPSMAQGPEDDYYWNDGDVVRLGPGGVWVIEVPAHPGDGEFELWFSAWAYNESRISVHLVDMRDYQTFESSGELPVEPLRSDTDVDGTEIWYVYWNQGEPLYIVIEPVEGNDADGGVTVEWYAEEYSGVIDDAIVISAEQPGWQPALWAVVFCAIVVMVAAIALVVWQERKGARGRGPGPLGPTGYPHLKR